jgi:two-component system, NarL family, sensor kinase
MKDEGVVDRGRPERAVGLARLAILVLIMLGQQVREFPGRESPAFGWILLGAGTYACVAAGLAWLGWRPRWIIGVESTLDLGLLSALLYTSGGAFSAVRQAYFLLPVLAAFSQNPRLTEAWALLSLVLYTAFALAEDPGLPGRESMLLMHDVYLAAIGAASVALAALLARRAGRLKRLADQGQALAVKAFQSVEAERKRIAYAIHDSPVQQLHAAQLDLSRAANGSVDAIYSARVAIRDALAALRDTIFDLHPHALDQLGFEAAVEQVAEREAAFCAACITLDIDPEAAWRREELCFAVGRELLVNAARHAEAHAITLRVAAQAGTVRLEVADDGRGIDPNWRSEALRNGHLGLTAVAERLAAVGGSLELDARAGGGTVARAVIPTQGDPAKDDAHGACFPDTSRRVGTASS